MGIREIKKLLNESAFNPKDKNSPLKPIIETDNIDYYLLRAKEFIDEARTTAQLNEGAVTIFHDKLIKAIFLLVLARSKN